MPLNVDLIKTGALYIDGAEVGGTVIDNEGNAIIANTSDNLVDVASGATHQIPLFSGLLLVNDHNLGLVELWVAGGGNTQLVSSTDSTNSTLSQNGFGYEWENVDGLGGPFTFTVIKTRNEA
jgi:hypothetical protein